MSGDAPSEPPLCRGAPVGCLPEPSHRCGARGSSRCPWSRTARWRCKEGCDRAPAVRGSPSRGPLVLLPAQKQRRNLLPALRRQRHNHHSAALQPRWCRRPQRAVLLPQRQKSRVPQQQPSPDRRLSFRLPFLPFRFGFHSCVSFTLHSYHINRIGNWQGVCPFCNKTEILQ